MIKIKILLKLYQNYFNNGQRKSGQKAQNKKSSINPLLDNCVIVFSLFFEFTNT